MTNGQCMCCTVGHNVGDLMAHYDSQPFRMNLRKTHVQLILVPSNELLKSSTSWLASTKLFLVGATSLYVSNASIMPVIGSLLQATTSAENYKTKKGV